MDSTIDLSQQLNHVEEQENNTVSSDNLLDGEENIQEPVPVSESEETTDIKTNNISDDIQETDTTISSTNMVTAEASFTEATSADLPIGATRSSVARILVKPGQIFRVQVDNEVKEVHGKFNHIS
ncbi:unnamed protein product [Adineta steineri]|uniref:Uncharacterized protein n=1 Tax=Adineta steineri TaxID=433720 RepID=A0A814YI68_9BILA|nr:unnamed protein product [Adineta steineri]CAF3709430.1 unnamed protein product [Adineta steineri]